MRDAAGRAEPVYVDSVSGQTLRGAAAEQAYGDHPTLIALFIRAGRVPEVKQRQIEAAIRDYAAPALVAAHPRVRLTEVLRSPQALAMLIDRQVHEGNVGRLEWALEHASLVNNMADPKDWPRLEAQVLDLTVQDSEARTIIAEQVEVAAAGMERAAAAARAGEAQFVSDGPTLAGAREALQYALNEAYLRLVVGERRDRLVHGLTATMTGTQAEQVRTGTPEMMAAHLDTLAANARELVSRMRFEYAIRNRLKGIRSSELPGPQR